MMRERRDVDFEMTVNEVLSAMSEGNPGALVALLMLVGKAVDDGFSNRVLDVYRLDDLNIRGPQIHVAFADWAGRDIEKFRQGIRAGSQEMIDVVNRECAYLGVLASRQGRQ